MKKLSVYMVVALIGVFSVFSCVQPLEPDIKLKVSGKHNLELTVSCQAPITKAYENYPAGENDYNENKIDFVDWFIFRDTTSGAAWYSKRDTLNNSNGTTKFTVASKNMDEYVTQYPDGKGYVLTIANYPSENGHAVFNGCTFSQIRQMALVTEELSSKLGVNDRTKKFVPLSNFVMSSYAVPFTLTEGTPAKADAKLNRQIAKISLDINIVPYIDEMLAHTSGLDTNSVEYMQTWYPDVANIRAYLTYANESSTLTPVTSQTDRYSVATYDEDHFFTYNSYGFIPEISYHNNNPHDTAYVAGSPFYSYPMRWETSDSHAPFIKIILAWKPVDESQEGNVSRNETCNFISHTTGGTHSGTRDVVNTHSFPSNVSSGNQKFYYKIAIPSENDFLRSNVWTKITLDVALLGGKEEETEVEVAGRYYVVNWSDPAVAAGGNLTSGKYLSLATPRDTFYIYGGEDISIPVISSHNLSASIVGREVYYNGAWHNAPKQVGSGASSRYVPAGITGSNLRGTVTPEGRTSVLFEDPLNRTVDDDYLDCFPMRFAIDITHAEATSIGTKRVWVVQYPSIYIDQKPGGNAMVDGYFGRVNSRFRGYNNTNPTNPDQGNSLTGDNKAQTPYAPIAHYSTGEINMTVLTVSAFSPESATYELGDEEFEYLIGDPRTASGFTASSLMPHAISDDAVTAWTDDQASKIKVSNKSARNFIAPKFMISSQWGRMVSWNTGNWQNYTDLPTLEQRHEVVEKRCATYQEAGYPAGRWRLPTEAEIRFIAELQAHNFIGTLFSATGPSITANVSVIRVEGGSVHYNEDDGRSCRCIYDLWYWGDDPVDSAATTYTIGVD